MKTIVSRTLHLCLMAAWLAPAGVTLQAQIKVLSVNPQQTDPAIEAVHGPHVALYDPQVQSNHKLFLFFVGTETKAKTSVPIDSAFAQWGYHAIALDYENNVITVACAHSQDSACFDHYREANISGAAVSDKLSVSPANSILNRLDKLLAYLVKQDPDGGWGEFVADGQPVWSRIVVAGHSQGAGHAAYLGKMFAVDEVVMLSGPQDYFADLDKPAPWLARPSATPQSRYFAFLNVNDPYNVHHQIANCAVLMGLTNPEPPLVKPGEAMEGNAQIYVNDADPKHAHMTTLLPRFENVWEYFGKAGLEDAGLKAEPQPPPQPTPLH